MKSIAVIGATGVVGRKILELLDKRAFPVEKLRLFASENSIGKTLSFRGEEILIERLTQERLKGIDLAFFAAGSTVSKEWIPKSKHVLCIDSSSFFRMDSNVPLVIPEINPHALKNHEGVIASPNCTATVLLLPLAPLHRRFRAKRLVVATYQAASGGGAKLQELLKNETRAALENDGSIQSFLPHPYAFNLYPHNSPLEASGYVGEEIKILQESRKILEDSNLLITATCIRVPVFQAHSVAANVEFHEEPSLQEAKNIVAAAPGVTLFEDLTQNRFATPLDATHREDILCGRFRIDPTQPKTLEFWSVGDQLLKGAALNAVQIAEHLI